MLRDIVDFWAELTGSVHPRDAPVFAASGDHGFNLDYPPPAYIGDVLNAPVLILDNNGGWDDVKTPAEFPDVSAHQEYRDTLANPQPLDIQARTVSPYYRSRNFTRYLVSGEAALVNAVAYRSVDGKSQGVTALSKLLPSARLHQNWLRNTVAPMVARGERFAVVHRWTRWNGAVNRLQGHPGAIFSTAPVSKDLTGQEIAAMELFLRRRA